mmetsp:Transcript_8997/g.30019  ORF Transcript_8997/g.30019 Transcript_8997/m.30019 type:complete len:223 (-) Transcript_8997:444-1112(-)
MDKREAEQQTTVSGVGQGKHRHGAHDPRDFRHAGETHSRVQTTTHERAEYRAPVRGDLLVFGKRPIPNTAAGRGVGRESRARVRRGEKDNPTRLRRGEGGEQRRAVRRDVAGCFHSQLQRFFSRAVDSRERHQPAHINRRHGSQRDGEHEIRDERGVDRGNQGRGEHRNRARSRRRKRFLLWRHRERSRGVASEHAHAETPDGPAVTKSHTHDPLWCFRGPG